ncbi:hypothetical protein BD311DRAFT_331844 [Dichomitus squalens]|uniref:Uncharacterized protein n=1 Tax=Dichomitus squalens TaxID=114155 RepID=A0A4Q9MMZ9_9APHY|nr:hypothetical protein BD311DRAFT_331844 [Dichomitus squalens]
MLIFADICTGPQARPISQKTDVRGHNATLRICSGNKLASIPFEAVGVPFKIWVCLVLLCVSCCLVRVLRYLTGIRTMKFRCRFVASTI